MSQTPNSRHRYVWAAAAAALALVAFTNRPIPRDAPATRVAPPRSAPSGSPRLPAAPVEPGRMAAEASEPNFQRDALFAYAHPTGREALDAALPAPTRAIHYVRLNSGLISGKQSPFWQARGAGHFVLPLPDGSALRIVIDASEMLGADRFTSTGRVEGRPGSRAVFAYNAGFLHASIEEPGQGSFALRAATADVSQFYQIDPALVPPCQGELRPDPALLAIAARRAGAGLNSPDGSGGVAAPGTAAAINPQRAEVHVMMVYTQSVLTTLAGSARVAALQSAFDATIARTNLAFDASLITARMKLVKIVETQFDENASAANAVQDEALTALYKTDDSRMDEIHAIRDQVGADIVCLALNRRDALSSGLSFLLDTPNQSANALFAFSVVQYSNVAGTNVVPHEFGHIFGCAHDRENAVSGAGAYPYSFGYRFLGRDGVQYRDIMSYPPGAELGYFSNPNVVLPFPISAALGIPAGQPGESDTARTIEQSAFAVANYRLQTQAAANAGVLVNVATRAFVGPGNQILIGGFVVEGAQPKRMLVRAAGPALAGFGVANPLGDPLLRIFSGPAKIFENDNWSSPSADAPASAGDIARTAAEVGAFAFVPGSRDAAVLVTLAPGPYTALVDGVVAGASGSALIEAYEVERNATRIVNLATRGYADNTGRELVGGFVVQGSAGSTKRILIRVLGPTLELAPFNVAGALFDPFLELRGANGELLMENDDWSSGAEVIAGERDDFKPRVRYYNEHAITATGFAPKNRREPCVLVDLPPGNFTVVVKPFEHLDSDPVFNQPARPGVGLVEIYEINR